MDGPWRELIEYLVRDGVVTPGWAPVFAAVPRAGFVPDRVWVGPLGDQLVDRALDPAGWAAAVAADQPLATHHTGTGTERVPSSSCSMPYMVATMLAHLDVHPGQRVLEVGTGTGWNAALLAHRLGDTNVMSIEVDPLVAEQAAKALKAAGYAPVLVVGDGLSPELESPVDRLIATCAIQTVPYAWVEAVRPGGVIVTPWGLSLRNGLLVRLTVGDDGTASGPVVDDATFMFAASQAPARDVMGFVADDHDTRSDATGLDPRLLRDPDAGFAIGLHLPGVVKVFGYGTGESAGEVTAWLADPATGSWAAVDYTPKATEFEVTAHGPRNLWGEVVQAYRWWWDLGRPERTRFGLTITPAGQQVWLDTPDLPVAG